MSETKRSNFRLRHVGMVFQFGGLVRKQPWPDIALPLQLLGTRVRAARARADELA